MPGKSFEALKAFFEEAPVARKATGPLHAGAEVGLLLDGAPARFAMEGGRPRVADEPPREPDFTLTIPAGAVARLTAQPDAEVGALGIEFFKLVLEKDPALKVRIRVQASTPKLLAHGYLGVLALGGLQVGMWLLRKGFGNPRAIIDRLRGK